MGNAITLRVMVPGLVVPALFAAPEIWELGVGRR